VKEKILLILDLDETLIHATEKELSYPADFQVFGYYVYKRPYLEEFMLGCNQHFKLAVWSSASDDYVEEIVKQIMPTEIKLEFVWGRSRCTYCFDALTFESAQYADYYSHYNYVKVLKKVKKRGYALERVLIVDDTPSKAKYNYGNVIYPSEYLGEEEDNELQLLLNYLITLKDIENVRTIEKRNWIRR
jgi:RNA polymerase II subunit A small phosphatase-like protein